MKEVYGIIRDCGDGSSYIDWFLNKDLMEAVMEDDPEAYYANEGSPSCTLTFDDDVDLEAAGFRFSDEEYMYILTGEENE